MSEMKKKDKEVRNVENEDRTKYSNTTNHSGIKLKIVSLGEPWNYPSAITVPLSLQAITPT